MGRRNKPKKRLTGAELDELLGKVAATRRPGTEMMAEIDYGEMFERMSKAKSGRARLRLEKARARNAAWRAALTPEQREARLEQLREWNKQRNRSYRDNPEASAAIRAKRRLAARKYRGIKDADLCSQRLKEQGGVCAICGTDDPGTNRDWHADHAHGTTRLRGMLCSRCNIGLGMFKDCPERLENAAAYLRRSKCASAAHMVSKIESDADESG